MMKRKRKIYKLFTLVVPALVVTGMLGVLYVYIDSQKPNTDFHKPDHTNWVSTTQGSIYINTFKSRHLNDSISLVFVIHGDAPFNKPGYQYVLAEKIAAENENTIAIAILRPGYTDPDNHTSNGIRGMTTGDNYTPEVIEAISEVIKKIKGVYHPFKTIVVGHSGGAAITGNLIGLKPGLTDAAVLVSCPCDVVKWRKHMRKKQPLNPFWYLTVKSISPNDVVENVSKETEIVMISGADDDITPIALSKAYHTALTVSGINADFISLPGEGHEILLRTPVTDRINTLLGRQP